MNKLLHNQFFKDLTPEAQKIIFLNQPLVLHRTNLISLQVVNNQDVCSKTLFNRRKYKLNLPECP